MRQVTSLFSSIMSGTHTVEHALVINNVWYQRDQIVSLSVSGSVFGSESPSVGNTCSRTISITMLAPSAAIPVMSQIVLKSRVTNGTQTSEWIDCGVFIVDTRKTNITKTGDKTTIELSGYDPMLFSEQDYIASGSWPKTDQQLLTELCQKMCVSTSATLDKGYSISKPDGYTIRELLGYLGAAYGGNWVFNGSGVLTLLVLGQNTGSKSLSFESLSKGDKLDNITWITLHKMDGTKFTYGHDQTRRNLNVDCPWATQAMAQNIWNAIGWYEYQPFEADNAIMDPTIELGDSCGVGIIYSMESSMCSCEVASIGAPAEEEIAHDYTSQSSTGGHGGGGSASRAAAQAKRDVLEQRNELIAALSTEDGAPESIAAGLSNYVRYDTVNETAYANSRLAAKIGSEAIASVNAEVKKDSNGKYSSLLSLTADVVNIEGRVDLSGTMTVSPNMCQCSKPFLASSLTTVQEGIWINSGNAFYKPKPVTFANGPFTVLAL